VSGDHPEIVFSKVNTEDEQDLAAHFHIRSIPTLMIFRDQIIIYQQAGALPEMAFRDLMARRASSTWTKCAARSRPSTRPRPDLARRFGAARSAAVRHPSGPGGGSWWRRPRSGRFSISARRISNSWV